jgi:hypothetical protein
MPQSNDEIQQTTNKPRKITFFLVKLFSAFTNVIQVYPVIISNIQKVILSAIFTLDLFTLFFNLWVYPSCWALARLLYFVLALFGCHHNHM